VHYILRSCGSDRGGVVFIQVSLPGSPKLLCQVEVLGTRPCVLHDKVATISAKTMQEFGCRTGRSPPSLSQDSPGRPPVRFRPIALPFLRGRQGPAIASALA